MNRKLIVLAFGLSAQLLATQARAGHLHLSVPRLMLSHPVAAQGQVPMVIPDNVLTGHGAIATPDGIAHF